eukprot:7744022-Pyramimonas_sp.AAC.1
MERSGDRKAACRSQGLAIHAVSETSAEVVTTRTQRVVWEVRRLQGHLLHPVQRGGAASPMP